MKWIFRRIIILFVMFLNLSHILVNYNWIKKPDCIWCYMTHNNLSSIDEAFQHFHESNKNKFFDSIIRILIFDVVIASIFCIHDILEYNFSKPYSGLKEV